MAKMAGAITDVPGVEVGHASDFEGLTGCTVVLFREGAIGGGLAPGMAAGTRGMDIFRSLHLRDEIHGVLLAGGSGFGLDATGGVMRYLEEQGIGFDVGITRVPRVPSAVIFDLPLGNCRRRPDVEMGYQACLNAKSGPVEQGSVGVGTGATVGKLYGLKRAMKGGVGTASIAGPYGVVGALAVVNAFGDVLDYRTGEILAGLRDESGTRLISTVEEMKKGKVPRAFDFGFRVARHEGQNTTLAVVAFEAALIKPELNVLALMAQRALVKTISPIHTTFDGDVIFTASVGRYKGQADLNVLGILAEEVLAEAVNNAVKAAKGLGGVPSRSDLLELNPKLKEG
ncbi:MAG: P1 family peptidase [Candidatus Acetothermia bacterium]|jgi:L-aminopeptidase/D-esterase-like protein|nr:P1 family peptidase [Candidatus Acetothermia bacterium]MDH7504819.1 P1 family peptidase [Candidatus Acetothermia bacterium]